MTEMNSDSVIETTLVTDKSNELLKKLIQFITRNGGSWSVSFGEVGKGIFEYSAMAEFGKEAPDSPMAGGASYGIGNTLEDALQQVADEIGLD